jgi:putative FmdB family regulatory protein
MPTYEYECQKCGHRFEVFQSINDSPKKICPKPKCRGRVKRVVGTGAGIIFKGSGFYSTDYRKPGYAEAAKKESGPSTAASPAVKGTTPAKPAAAKTSKE